MILAAFVLGALTALVPSVYLLRATVAENRRLFGLLEAKAAPAEYAAYVAPLVEEPEEDWVFSEDGLVGFPVPRERD